MSKRLLSLLLVLLLAITPVQATDVNFTGLGAYVPAIPGANPALAYNSTLVIDATGEKMSYLGPVWFPGRTGSKTINKAHFRFGAITKAGGSALTASLQDISLTASTMQPDEAQDQYRAIANGDAGFASNTWYSTGLLTSDGTDTGTKRSVVYGALLALVLEYDGGGRLGLDSVVMSALNVVGTSIMNGIGGGTLKTASWATQNAGPVIVLEFSDGTYGTILSNTGLPASAVNSHTFNLDTAGADEYALEVKFPFPVRIDGAYAAVRAAVATSDFEVLLYSGTTVLETTTVIANSLDAVNTVRIIEVAWPERILTANTLYRLAVRPTTANNILIYSFDVSNAAFLDLVPGGQAFAYSTRVDQGSWSSTTTTRRIVAGVRLSSLSDGAGGGGGGSFTFVQ